MHILVDTELLGMWTNSIIIIFEMALLILFVIKLDHLGIFLLKDFISLHTLVVRLFEQFFGIESLNTHNSHKIVSWVGEFRTRSSNPAKVIN